MKIEARAIEALIPYINNARTHSDAQVAQIAASIREFGWTNPVLVDGENGIIAGHGRLMAARKLGMDEVPVIELAHMTPAQKRAYILADNKLALNSGWDDELLRIELDELADIGFDIELTGFTLGEVESMSFEDDALDEMPGLPEGDREPFQQITFTLHDEQVEQIRAAIDSAKALGPFDSPNENGNGNAIARICEAFLTHYGHR